MKKVIMLLILLVSTLVMAQERDRELTGTLKLEVDGLSCPFCAYGLEKKLKDVNHVNEILIDVENAFVILTIATGQVVKEETLRKNVTDAGFTPRKIAPFNDD